VLASLLPLFAFGALLSAAALAYPGGTWEEPAREGFSFWHNFWCDLLHIEAVNGQSNVLGSGLARLAFLCFAFALYRFWPLAAACAGPQRALQSAQRLGRFGALTLLAVALIPSAISELVHAIAVVTSAGASLTAVGMLLRPLIRRGERVTAALAAVTVAVALLCLTQYVYQGCGGGESASWLAGMQKITTFGLLALMVRVLVRTHATDSGLKA
jgi:hypothetical protein